MHKVRRTRPVHTLRTRSTHSRGRTPLRRTSDRIESWFCRFLLLVFALGLPVAALSAGQTAYESSLSTVQTQSAERQQVTARLMSNVKGGTEDAGQQAPIRWTDKNGTARTGTTLVKSGTPKGAGVRAWVDRDGSLSSPPMTAQNARATGWLVGGVTAVGAASGFFAARTGVRLVLNRKRYAQWDTEWDLVEPLWSARFRQ